MTASARGIAPSPTMTLTPAVVLGSAATQPTTDRSIPESKRKYEADIRDLLAARWNDLDSLIVTADEQVSGDQTQNLHVVFRFSETEPTGRQTIPLRRAISKSSRCFPTR